MNTAKITGIALATAAASLFSMASVSTAFAGEGKVACEKSTACKGTGACKSASSACKGQNACKGTGVTEQKSAADCAAAQAAAKKA